MNTTMRIHDFTLYGHRMEHHDTCWCRCDATFLRTRCSLAADHDDTLHDDGRGVRWKGRMEAEEAAAFGPFVNSIVAPLKAAGVSREIRDTVVDSVITALKAEGL